MLPAGVEVCLRAARRPREKKNSNTLTNDNNQPHPLPKTKRTTHPPTSYGFIVMDGNGTLFGTLSGNTRDILHKFTVDLPKKHGRGGQSAMRFARLRMEKRHNYVRKVAEMATSRSSASRNCITYLRCAVRFPSWLRLMA